MPCQAVTFSYANWVARYPEFTAVSSATAQQYFNEATIYWANNAKGPVTSYVVQASLLNMLTAHIAALYSQSQNDPSPGSAQDSNTPVGRISSGTEGSVSIAIAFDPTNPEQWYAQTKYGASFWAATAQYRLARFIPGRLQQGSGPSFGTPNWGRNGGFY